jgi:hypothetical protein
VFAKNFNLLYNLRMKWFGKKIEKESNKAKTPEQTKKPTKLTKARVIFFIWNILSIILYSSYTLFVSYRMAEKTFLSKVIVYLLYAYAGAFVFLILINLGNKKKLKSGLKNYKSATNFLKYFMQIVNFVLSIITAVSALFSTGTADFVSVIYATLSFIVTLVMILFEIAGIIIRKNMPIIKYNFLEMRDKAEPRETKRIEH